MQRTTPPFRVDHVGSLLRPPELIAARDKFEAGDLDHDALAKEEDQAIKGVVALQEAIGLQAITDGEYRRTSYLVDFVNGIEGVVANPREGEGWDYQSASGDGTTVPATRIGVSGKVSWPKGGILLNDFNYLKPLTSRTIKMTMPAPNQIYWFGGRDLISRDAYPDLGPFWDDLIAVYRAEIAALAAAGCRYIQIDETCLPKLSDPNMQDVLTKRGDDWRALIEIFTDTMARVAADPPDGVTIVMHHCRGNSRGHWQAEGSYEMVAENMFNRIPVAAHFLEYDSPRAGDFSPLRVVPDDKMIVLGLVSTKIPALESADDIKRRIGEASQYIPIERLCLSPQCGFSSSHSGHPLTLDDQKRKIELMMSVADDVWGSGA